MDEWCLLYRKKCSRGEFGAFIPDRSSDCYSYILMAEENGGFVTDVQGSLKLDHEAVTSFINSLAEEYNTYGKTIL